ncbi:MAG: hypothetical protein M1825_000139 [Sarcosagium campestre]|nr:MAG: hypothetical protein M1825_000139 [Sarcosagium campestre]
MVPPPPKRRKKSTPAVEEISFDPSAREDYLTGFHKRKLQRIKYSQDLAEKKERAERLEFRRKVGHDGTLCCSDADLLNPKLREDRKAEAQSHVEAVNALVKQANGLTPGDSDDPESEEGGSTEWEGIDDSVCATEVNREEQYIDEDRFTSVTVEAVKVSREGLHNLVDDDETPGKDVERPSRVNGAKRGADIKEGDKRQYPNQSKSLKPKKKRKKFRYENKAERKVTRAKERAGNSAKARERRK